MKESLNQAMKKANSEYPTAFSDALEVRKILQDRAKRYAGEHRKEIKQKKGDSFNGLAFFMSGEEYIIDNQVVEEVLPLRDYTPLPGVPSFIMGVFNARGRILSLVDLKQFFHLPETGITNLNRVIIVRKESIEFGILVDEIFGSLEVFTDTLKRNLLTVSDRLKKFIIGVDRNRAIVLDIEKLLASGELIIDEEI